jgi:HSP20 family protein
MLMRSDPFRELDRMTESMLGTRARPAMMPMVAYRDGDTFVVHLDLPGVSADAIDLAVEQNVLSVHAERRSPLVESAERLVDEGTYGVLRRQLFLGDTLDSERMTADYDAGVLTLKIPIAERAKPRKVEIASGDDRQEVTA